jgi:SAM-dependent methyltransferase
MERFSPEADRHSAGNDRQTAPPSPSQRPDQRGNVRGLYEEFPFPLNRNQYAFLQRYVFPHAPQQPARILDAGCGTGNMTVDLAARFPSADVVGIDFSEHSLAKARLLAEGRKLSNIGFVHHDLMEELSPSDSREGYDFAVSIGCLHHLPDPAAALRHIRAVLSDGAVLILGVYGKYGRLETEMRRTLFSLLREATGRTTADLIPLCDRLLSEPALRENGFYKLNVFLMPLRNPQRFASLVKQALRAKLGMRPSSDGIPSDISRADQYLHPLVLNWTAGEWLATIASAGLQVKHFIYEPGEAGMCMPRNPLSRIKDRDVRVLLEGMPPNSRYEALDLIFRPSMHIISCTPTS